MIAASQLGRGSVRLKLTHYLEMFDPEQAARYERVVILENLRKHLSDLA